MASLPKISKVSKVLDHSNPTAPEISLEAVWEEHAAAIQALAEDPVLGASTNLPTPYPPGGALSWVRQTQRLHRGGREWSFAVFAEGRLVGCCCLLGVGGRLRSGELSFWIGRPFWGRGYATAAAQRVVELGFRELDLHALRSCCLIDNEASRRVLEKVGFRCSWESPHPRAGSPFSKWAAEDRFLFFELGRLAWSRHLVGLSPLDDDASG